MDGSVTRYSKITRYMWRHHKGDAAWDQTLFDIVQVDAAMKVMSRESKDSLTEYKLMSPQAWCRE